MPAAHARRAAGAASAQRPTERRNCSAYNPAIAGFFYWLGPAFEIGCLLIRELFLSGFGEDGHSIAVGKEAIVEGYGFFIGCEYSLPTG